MKSLPYQGIARMSKKELIIWQKIMEIEYGIKFSLDGYIPKDRKINVIDVKVDGYE